MEKESENNEVYKIEIEIDSLTKEQYESIWSQLVDISRYSGKKFTMKQGLAEISHENSGLNKPVVIWRFCAYKTEKDYESGEHYFVKDFLDHTEMKVFSGKHSAKEKPLYSDYCSMYWKIEANAT